MAAAVGDPRHRVACAALVVGANDLARPGAGLGGVLGLAAVETDEAVTELTAGSDGEDVVGRTVNAEVGDGTAVA